MKYLVFIVFLTGCSYYTQEVFVTIEGLSRGSLTISGPGYLEKYMLSDQTSFDVLINKGETYLVEFRPMFHSDYSRFALGGIISARDSRVLVSPYLGVITQAGIWVNNEGYNLSTELLYKLKEKLEVVSDPWIYDQLDIKYYLLGEITIGSISKKRRYEIPELEYLHYLEPENELFSTWYPSVQSFYDSGTNSLFKVEIYEDGSFCGFEVAK